MKVITSTSNPLYKDLVQIATKPSARKKQKLTILDGFSLTIEYLDRVGTPEMCIVSDSGVNKQNVAEIIRKCCELNTLVVQLSDRLFDNIVPVEHSAGVCFLVKIPQNKVTKNSALEIKTTSILLERIQDPGNLGSIIRTAAAAGIDQIFCSEGSVSAFSPKVLRAAMGAQFFVKIYENVDLECLMQKSRIPIVATSSHAKNSLYEEDLSGEIVWLFGNESNGVSDELMTRSAKTVAIPHLGQIESLNVSVAAAICFFEQVRQKV